MRKVAFGLYLLFIASWFLHAPARFPFLGAIRFDFVLVCLITGLILLSPREVTRTPEETRVRTLILVLAIYAVLTVPFCEWPGSVLKAGLPNFLKAVVFYFFTEQLISSERRLRYLLLVFVGSQTFRIVEPLYLHVTQGYWGSFASMAGWETMNRLSGAPFDTINPNGLAFVILSILPFWHYLAPATAPGCVAYLAVLPPSLYALMLTGSRSGLLGLGIVFLVIWVKSRRKILLGGVLAVCAIAAIPKLSADTADRYLSIVSSDTRNAATAQSRLEQLRGDFKVALRRPIFGHGLGTSREANANFRGVPLRAHNLYAESAQEIGFVGLVLVVMLITATAWGLVKMPRRSAKSDGTRTLLTRVGDAGQVYLAMIFIFSFASYGLSSYEWYFLAGLSAVLNHLSPAADERGGATGKTEGEPLSPSGVPAIHEAGSQPLL